MSKKCSKGVRITMDKTDKERQQVIDDIVKRANKEIQALSKPQTDIIAAAFLSVMAQVEELADTIGISRDVLLFGLFTSIFNRVTSESGCAEKKTKPTAKTHKPPKGGFIPPKGGFIQ